MKILIVDDEPLAVLRLQKMLGDLGCDDIITATNGQKAIEAVKKYHPGVVFLDIEMPVLRGIDAAPAIKTISPESKIIFCTAYDDFAIEAFDLSASDYLLKPVTQARLSQALAKVSSVASTQLAVTFQQGNDLLSVDIEDIYCFISEDKYTTMHCKLGEIIIDESLVSLETRFVQQLLRVNRNALINLLELYGIHREKNLAYAKLRSTKYQPQISRRNIAILKDRLK
ncbi:hypothetical protein MNBD_GAMMA01-1097 [hydrothermal vent metagenome]|uniref:Uncharacterized protein n=1 Tax=hydrothermal vent metagenome TaxID=652676 RepID=A0A3B0WCN8_9ZZZZ